MFAKIKSKISGKKIYFKKQDIFNEDLSGAEVVYTYLWYDLMPALEKKLQNELKSGSMVITNTSHFHNWEPIEKIVTNNQVYDKIPDFETLFVYIKK